MGQVYRFDRRLSVASKSPWPEGWLVISIYCHIKASVVYGYGTLNILWDVEKVGASVRQLVGLDETVLQSGNHN